MVAGLKQDEVKGTAVAVMGQGRGARLGLGWRVGAWIRAGLGLELVQAGKVSVEVGGRGSGLEGGRKRTEELDEKEKKVSPP